MEHRWFASDNNATTHPEVMEALAKANFGHAVGYGDDPLSSGAETRLASLFGQNALVRFVLNGTGANVYALGCYASPGDAIFCSRSAHIYDDESAAPEAAIGAQLHWVETKAGKIVPEALKEALLAHKKIHRPRPRMLSLSQPTELGTIYNQAEMAELFTIAKEAGLFIHIDGARLANAAAATGLSLAEVSGFSMDIDGKGGADAVCFGATKNGLMYGEAIIFSKRSLATDSIRLRKTRLQLASKMRFISAQFDAYLKDDLWKQNATKANSMARLLEEGLRSRGIYTLYPAEANGVFAKMDGKLAGELRKKHFFYDWEQGSVRLMCSWDTSEEDVKSFLNDLDEIRKGQIKTASRHVSLDKAALTRIEAGRAFLKSNWEHAGEESDMDQGLPMPAYTEPPAAGASLFSLPEADKSLVKKDYFDIVQNRRSRRRYKPEGLSLAELSFLLWASGGIKTVKNGNAFRTVPSGGCRHPMDLIVYARKVDGLAPGLYRYIPLENSLAQIRKAELVDGAQLDQNGWLDLDEKMNTALSAQLRNCPALFVWTAVPYRTEWRYPLTAAKTILIDAGISCQALYSAAEALDLGTVAQADYRQKELDEILGLDGQEEFAVLTAPVGRQ